MARYIWGNLDCSILWPEGWRLWGLSRSSWRQCQVFHLALRQWGSLKVLPRRAWQGRQSLGHPIVGAVAQGQRREPWGGPRWSIL